ncbi:hypothetical protein GGX14DRAFT_635522 [Mycena pura]|uniref:F-box domain-containing protein n=1 Tax=Mycena pura TaxID=153505 RepID=A0AAD6VCR6_9AGAR|nr:hypothetical protein GGX14DRAFT_635522 [Mycena pura]
MVFETLLDLDDTEQPYGHELCSGACLIPLSETCRHMRAVTLPWIFHEVYNWRRHGVDVWPDTLWCFFRTVHIRDHSVRRPSQLWLTPQMYGALPKMEALTKVTLRLQAAIPIELLSALSSVCSLSVLEIHQVRFDGPSPDDLSFPSLSSLSIGIGGFRGVGRVPDINKNRERENIATFLRSVSQHLTTLCISGDLLSSQEHAPSPFIHVPNLIAQMPVLRSLGILFTPSPQRNSFNLPVAFTLGTSDGSQLGDISPHLTSVSFSNIGSDDPIYRQLPSTLESLHLMPLCDRYAIDVSMHPDMGEFRFLEEDAATALENISNLDQLVDLTFTPFVRPPSPEVISTIARQFPMLRCLHLGSSMWLPNDLYLVEFPEKDFLEALRLIQCLRHLKVSFDIFWDSLDRGPPAYGAYRLMQELPDLQTVSHCWRHCHATSPHRWDTWDRSLLLQSTPPRIPKEIPDIELQRAL